MRFVETADVIMNHPPLLKFKRVEAPCTYCVRAAFSLLCVCVCVYFSQQGSEAAYIL